MENNCTIQGYVFKTELIKTRAGKHIQTLWITDYTDSIMVKRFENNTTNTLEDIKVLDKGKVWIKATGEIRLDNYARETVMMARQIEVIKEPARRQDTVEVKRVELHTHSKMSAMDGIGNVSDYINQVAKWGHKAIAVTDHGNVQSFPEAQAASLKAGNFCRKRKIKYTDLLFHGSLLLFLLACGNPYLQFPLETEHLFLRRPTSKYLYFSGSTVNQNRS